MDKVRTSFIKKMKVSSQLHTTSIITGPNIAEIELSNSLDVTPMMKRITEQGWALPQQQNFRYSYRQKRLLYDIFMEGEKTGRKKSPEEVEKILRRKFKNPDEYVTSSQIRSLFSAFARKLKQGTLKAPEQKCNLDELDEDEESDEEVRGDDEEEYQVDLQREVLQVMTDLAEWEVNDYVAVVYDKDWYPGQIIQVNDDGSVDVNCMKYVDKFQGTNKFLWPQKEDKKPYEKDELLLKLDAPREVTTGKRLQYYEFSESDFKDTSGILKMVLGTK